MQKVKIQKSSGNYKMISLLNFELVNFALFNFSFLLRQTLIEIRSDQQQSSDCNENNCFVDRT